MYCHPVLSSKGTNVKDLVYIHVGTSEMLHFVTNDEFTICHNRIGFPQEIGTTNDEFTICHNRMGFPQEIGTQHDK